MKIKSKEKTTNNIGKRDGETHELKYSRGSNQTINEYI